MNNLPFDPMFHRESEMDFNDGWLFSIDGNSFKPINVPFCPQSSLSGVEVDPSIHECYYKKTFTYTKKGEQVLLHFGAVDHIAMVFLNGTLVNVHQGGYTPFEVDLSKAIQAENTLLIHVIDHNDSFFGKQSFKDRSFGCFYTRTIGIWQPVHLYTRPENHIRSFRFYPSIKDSSVDVELWTSGVGSYHIEVFHDEVLMGEAQGTIEYRKRIPVLLKECHLWELGKGELYDVRISFENDAVSSYFGLREVHYEGYDFYLNGKKTYQRFVLDQGFYPDGIYTAPSLEAMEKDILLSLRLGFNGGRLHMKVFDPRYLYLCDKLGYMVWGEFPSWGGDYSNLDQLGQFLKEWGEALTRDINHPCIVTWCPMNEVWGDWADPRKKRDIAFVDEVYAFTKGFDSTRPVVDASGGHHGHSTDLYDFHCYENVESLKSYFDRIEQEDVVEISLLDSSNEKSHYKKGTPLHFSECGGIAFGAEKKDNNISTINEGAVQSEESWGYGASESSGASFVARYKELIDLVYRYKKISGFCYTQLYDVEQEQNGFYHYDRSDKLTEEEKDQIRAINLQLEKE